MRGINKVILVGNVGKEPEVRYLPSGNAVANLSIATSESWTDKNSGQKQDIPDRASKETNSVYHDFSPIDAAAMRRFL